LKQTETPEGRIKWIVSFNVQQKAEKEDVSLRLWGSDRNSNGRTGDREDRICYLSAWYECECV